jgi:hypothetical protein
VFLENIAPNLNVKYSIIKTVSFLIYCMYVTTPCLEACYPLKTETKILISPSVKALCNGNPLFLWWLLLIFCVYDRADAMAWGCKHVTIRNWVHSWHHLSVVIPASSSSQHLYGRCHGFALLFLKQEVTQCKWQVCRILRHACHLQYTVSDKVKLNFYPSTKMVRQFQD